jgi:hypothetical protein
MLERPHWSATRLVPRSRAIAGTAKLTTVASRKPAIDARTWPRSRQRPLHSGMSEDCCPISCAAATCGGRDDHPRRGDAGVSVNYVCFLVRSVAVIETELPEPGFTGLSMTFAT